MNTIINTIIIIGVTKWNSRHLSIVTVWYATLYVQYVNLPITHVAADVTVWCFNELILEFRSICVLCECASSMPKRQNFCWKKAIFCPKIYVCPIVSFKPRSKKGCSANNIPYCGTYKLVCRYQKELSCSMGRHTVLWALMIYWSKLLQNKISIRNSNA